MTSSPIRKKLIEVSIPLDAINAASKKQKAPKGYPTALHKYWAQRPIAACRAVLFAQLVDDPISWPDRFPTLEGQEIERRRLHKVLEAITPWQASNDAALMRAARYEIARSVAWALGEDGPSPDDGAAILAYLQAKAPPVYDPFSGGASIPLEAQRLGLRAFGSDLNPVAVLVGKGLVEIPSKFNGQAPINPEARERSSTGALHGWIGAQGLADDVRFYGARLRQRAESVLGHLYPDAHLGDGSQAKVIAWIWARTVRSPDPSARGAMVPLVSTYMLSTKEGRKNWAEFVRDESAPDGWRFEVKTGPLSKEREAQLKKGTVSRSGGGTCALTDAPMPFAYLRQEASAGRFGTRLMAVVAAGSRGRIFVSPTPDQEVAADIPTPDVPELEISHWPGRTNVVEYGMKTFGSLFTARQATALQTFSEIVPAIREEVLADAKAAGLSSDEKSLEAGGLGAVAYADAVATYLAFGVSRAADYGSTISTWLTDDNAIRGTFGRQAIPMTWDYCEGNYFGDSSAALTTIFKTMPDVIAHQRSSGFGEILQIDASKNGYPERPCVINTDPPYYDNVAYADLSDFFYLWLRQSLSNVWPSLMRRLSTPKDPELVATPYRHGGKSQAEAFFMEGMGEAFQAMRAAASDEQPTAIYYAFKQSETASDGTTSAGWATFLQAVVSAGFVIDGTWPLRTESAGRLIGRGANALASSVVLVCRKRPSGAPEATRADFIRALKREMPTAIDAIRKAGVGPVDMQQSVIGPGMEVFSRHTRILEDDDTTMSVRTALTVINRVWEEIDNELDQAFDAETQVALAWYASYGFDTRVSGELITLATAKNTSDRALFASGVFKDLRGKSALTPREELPVDWSPKTDTTLTVWECVQHTARILNAANGGGEAAAALVALMGARSEDARALAYRLFEIATNRGWASEALVYNELAQEWSKLEDRASALADGAITASGNQSAFSFEGDV